MKLINYLGIAILIYSFNSCTPKESRFEEDFRLLKSRDEVVFLKEGDAILAVAGPWQGRVLASSSGGLKGLTTGWYNRELVLSNNVDEKLSKLGGESRFLLAPEVGKYSVFFDPGSEQIPENIKISAALDTARFQVTDQGSNFLICGGEMQIRNANGYLFNIAVNRKITLKCKERIELELGINYDCDISAVAFSTETTMKNTGSEAWSKDRGLLSIWEVSCIRPSKRSVVVMPIRQRTDTITVYFTAVDSTRLKITDKFVYYRGDAAYMNKIGLQPELCTGTFGSYCPEEHLLTILKYNFENNSMYANCLWSHKDPYKGDVINVFNGEVNDSLGRNWPFYELESLSGMKELGVGEEVYHSQSVYHFEGEEGGLDKIAQKLLGVSLNDITTAFSRQGN